MLVEVSPNAAVLIGYLSPSPHEPGFVLPLFRRADSNSLSAQDIAIDGTVVGFRDIVPRDVHDLNLVEAPSLSVGDRALWGFIEPTGQQHFATMEDIKPRLQALLPTVHEPFLRLQIAQFCEDEVDLESTWRSAFEHISRQSSRSANAWRDVVIIPSNVRSAIHFAVLAHGLDASVGDLERSVTVRIERDELHVRLDPDLYAEFSGNREARETLGRQTRAVRQAFNLAQGPLALSRVEQPPSELTDAGKLEDEIAIIAIGNMATGLMRQTFPFARNILRSEFPGSVVLPAYELDQVVIFKGGKFRAMASLLEVETLTRDLASDVTFVVFEMSADRPYLIDAAREIAVAHRAKGRKIFAVIPHLPEAVSADVMESGTMLQEIQRNFDAVWVLSDRSPYTRQSLPYGPSRSVQASAAHFSYLLDLARYDDLRLLNDEQRPPGGPNLSVIASAKGDQAISKLFEHAMARLNHYQFSFASVDTVSLHYDGPDQPLDGIVVPFVVRHFPAAVITIDKARPNLDAGPKRLTLALQGVETLRPGPAQFEQFCAEQLAKQGWTTQRSDVGEADILASVGNQTPLFIKCKYYGEYATETALRARSRRQREIDSILITNATIRRRFFARSILNGIVPIHFSKIEALLGIYRRRYSYVLRTLNQSPKDATSLLVPSAVDVVNMLQINTGFATRFKTAKFSAAIGITPKIEIFPTHAIIELVLQMESTTKTVVRRPNAALARLLLDVNGWRLLSLDGHENKGLFR